jgi:hypothetical protein
VRAYSAATRTGALPSTSAAASATGVPSKKSGFCVPKRRTALAKAKARSTSTLSSSVSLRRSATASGANGSRLALPPYLISITGDLAGAAGGVAVQPAFLATARPALPAWRITVTTEPISIVFTTRQEAKLSCLAGRSAGSGISGHTSRRRTHQSPHARYPPRNLGRSGVAARVRRRKELRCAERGPTLMTNLRAPRTNPASGLDESRRRDRCAAASKQDQLDREYDGG